MLMALLIVLGEEPEVVRDWFEIQVRVILSGFHVATLPGPEVFFS